MPTLLGIKDGSFSCEYSLEKLSTQKDFQLTYLIKGDSTSDTELDIVATTNLPVLRTLTRGAVSKVMSIKETNAQALLWEVTINYTSKCDSSDNEDQEDPTDRTPEWYWSTETVEEQLEYDAVTEDPIINAVGEQILLNSPRTIVVLTISRLEESFDPDTILDYANHVNSKKFWGAPIGTVLLSDISDDPEEVDGEKLRRVEYTFKFKIRKDSDGNKVENTWKARPLHQGTKYLETKGDDLDDAKDFKTKTGGRTTGNLQGEDSDDANWGEKNTSDAEHLSFNRFPVADYETLDLGPYT